MLDEMAKRRKARHRRSVLMGVVAVAASAVVAVGAFAGVDALVTGSGAGGQHHVAAAPNWDTGSGHDVATSVRAIVRYRPQSLGDRDKRVAGGRAVPAPDASCGD